MAEIILYGVIGDPADKLDAATVTSAIRKASGPLSVRINSPGGYVMEGLAIVSALRAYPGPVTIHIDGLAASMASVIAMVGDNCQMAETAFLMVHKPWDASIGNAAQMRTDAAQLDRIEGQMIEIYAKRTGLHERELAAMLAAETWFTAEEALAAGFVNSIAAPIKLAAMARATGYGFRHLPAPLKEPAMTDLPDTATALADERTRTSTIISLCDKHKLGAAMAAEMIEKDIPLGRAREIILERLAERSDSAMIGHNGPHLQNGGTLDNPTNAHKAMGDALYARMTGRAPEGAAREFMACSMVDMARMIAEAQGVRGARTMAPENILQAAAWNRGDNWGRGGYAAITTTTSDFPDLLQGTGHRFLMDVYKAAESPMKQLGRQRSATDFRPISGLQLSNFGTLDQTNEGGEIKTGHFTSRKETYSLATFTKNFNLSRQAIINDDLGAFSDVLTIMGRAAAETQAVALAALLSSNPTMGDGQPLFSAPHNNLAGAYTPPTVAALTAARLAMRGQIDLDGVTPLSTAPKFVLAGAAQETAIEQLLLSTTNPQSPDQVNPFAGKLTPLIDPRIRTNAWYLFADPTLTPVLEYAYLNGGDTPTVEQQESWTVLGQQFRVYQDFGCGFIDWRGAYEVPNG